MSVWRKSQRVPWEEERCRHKGAAGRCKGIQLGKDGYCLAHTSPGQRDLALAMFHAGADLSFTRGVPFTEPLILEILKLAPEEGGSRVLINADFTLATFSGTAKFTDVTFSGTTSFADATFNEVAHFSRATFGEAAFFWGAIFSGTAWFDWANFSGIAWFNETIFSEARFNDTTFSGEVVFEGATFSEVVWFDGATFSATARFKGATFSWASFSNTTFEEEHNFGPSLVLGKLDFDEARFSESIDIEVGAKQLSCRRTKFRDGANLRIRWADITLDDTSFSSPCLVDRASAQFEGLDESKFLDEREPAGQPRIVSMRRADVANLALASVDMHGCRFAGAHKLDGLRIEGKQQFARGPQGWRIGLSWPLIWRWTERRVVAEEHEWRCIYEQGIRHQGWYPEECQPPAPEEVRALSAAEIQRIYRDLRKGREDNKDEPGAADFYYGEMEMRRAAIPPSFEKLVLWLYWLVSGYGLRASRALAALGVTIAAFGFMFLTLNVFVCSGQDPCDESLTGSLLFSAQSTTSLLRAPDQSLTHLGQALQIMLRLLGPLFFGLVLLSLRGRVKR